MREGGSVWKRGGLNSSHLGGEQGFVLPAEPVAREEERGDSSLGEVPRPAGWTRRPPGGGKEPFFPGTLGKGVGEWARKGILRGKDGKQGSLHLHGSAR